VRVRCGLNPTVSAFKSIFSGYHSDIIWGFSTTYTTSFCLDFFWWSLADDDNGVLCAYCNCVRTRGLGIQIYACVCLCVYVCVCVCMYVCLCLCMYVCVCVCLCMYVCRYVCVCVCMLACVCLCVCVDVSVFVLIVIVFVLVVWVRIYIHVWICMQVVGACM